VVGSFVSSTRVKQERIPLRKMFHLKAFSPKTRGIKASRKRPRE
jgi:hypothetical protein